MWSRLEAWIVGPMFDEWLAQRAAEAPGEAVELRDCYGDYPSIEDLAASAEERRRDRAMAVADSFRLADLIRTLHATFPDIFPAGDEGHPCDPPLAGCGQAAGAEVAKDYAIGWPEVLKTLNRKHGDRETVRGLNDKFHGPIQIAGQGSRPMANKAELISWWNNLESMHQENSEERSRQDEDRKATTSNQYRHGKEGHADTEVPDISGRVKRRRTS
jgi:hypothetical protein